MIMNPKATFRPHERLKDPGISGVPSIGALNLLTRYWCYTVSKTARDHARLGISLSLRSA